MEGNGCGRIERGAHAWAAIAGVASHTGTDHRVDLAIVDGDLTNAIIA